MLSFLYNILKEKMYKSGTVQALRSGFHPSNNSDNSACGSLVPIFLVECFYYALCQTVQYGLVHS